MRRSVTAAGLAALLWAIPAAITPIQALAANATTCEGELAAGTYGAVVVPEDGVCISEGPVTIRGGLEIGPGATFVLGSEENPVPTGTISGGVRATNPASVQIHFTTINGGVEIHGGSGPFGGPFDITWTTIEDSVIHGGVVMDGYNGFWNGFIRNDVRGTVNMTNNVSTEDPDANEYVTNTIRGNLNCSGNSPAPQVGDSEGEPNVVSGQKTGQCSEL
jgi:hypothetical protein